MQLYAQDNRGQTVFVAAAVKQQDYYCRECQSIVHLRGGLHRQRHFYHVNPDRACASSGKSMEHLQVQYYLLDLLPSAECHLEYRFPSIGRIADLVWLPKKLIFEIQCSPISAEELSKRNEDYAKMGFYVIWILHDNRFNQMKLSAAEELLKTRMFYFTNIDHQGQGMIYDQFSLLYRDQREQRFPPLPINLASIQVMSQIAPVSGILKMRQHCWPYFFSGDLMDCYLKGIQKNYFERIQVLEQLHQDQPTKSIRYWYEICLQMLLEKACR